MSILAAAVAKGRKPRTTEPAVAEDGRDYHHSALAQVCFTTREGQKGADAIKVGAECHISQRPLTQILYL